MTHQDKRPLIKASELPKGQYFSIAEFPTVLLKCHEHDVEDGRIIAICCDPWYHKLAISYEDSILPGMPE